MSKTFIEEWRTYYKYLFASFSFHPPLAAMSRAVSDPYLVADDLEDVQVEAEPPNKEWVTSETAGSVKDEPQEEPWGDEDVWDDSWCGSWDQWDWWNDNTEKAAEKCMVEIQHCLDTRREACKLGERISTRGHWQRISCEARRPSYRRAGKGSLDSKVKRSAESSSSELSTWCQGRMKSQSSSTR